MCGVCGGGGLYVCVWGGGTVIIILIDTYARHQQLLFSFMTVIPRCVTDAF